MSLESKRLRYPTETARGNITGRKSLDRLARDARILEVWDEGSDGYWGSLAAGFNCEGASVIHAWTVKDLYEQLGVVTEGDTY